MNKNDEELDKKIKQELENKINPSQEFQDRIKKMVEEKKKQYEQENIKYEEKSKIVELKNAASKFRKLKLTSSILSMAAVFIMVFALGLNLKNQDLKTITTESQVVRITGIEPTKLESGILAKDSEFTIYVEGDNPSTEDVQKSIYMEPALDYTIEKTLNKNEYILKVKQNIPDNTILKLQYVKNQITQDSWAYQTSTDLSVTKTYPYDNEKKVSKNTTIQVEFSYANVENFENNVKIEPDVKGKWEHKEKTWIFIPEEELEYGEYRVTIKAGINAEKEKLKSDYIFGFRVSKSYNNDDVEYSQITIDKITTANPNELVRIMYNNYKYEEIDFGKVEISKFKNIDEFIEYVKTNDYSKATDKKEYEIEDRGSHIELKEKLQKGYYVAKVKDEDDDILFMCPIQISDVSAYAMETERDILVWVAKNGNLAEGINVTYNNENKKTSNNGIARFNGKLKDDKSLDFLKISNELVVGIYNYSKDNYPRGYVYTDRPLYKNNDTINVWGYVPTEFFYDEVEDDFYIELNSDGKQKISVDKDGNFKYKFDLKNYMDQEYAYIDLYYKNTEIAFRRIEIKNYELQNYSYEVIANKNYAYINEAYEFDVKVTHITGIAVPNKSVKVNFNGDTYIEKTGKDGKARFSIKINVKDDDKTIPNYEQIQIFNGDNQEYTDQEENYDIQVLTRNTYTDSEYRGSGDSYNATLYKLDLTKNEMLEYYDNSKLYNGTYETKVDVILEEIKREAKVVGHSYDYYTKQNEPEYDYETTKKETKVKTITSKDGKVLINRNELEIKENTKNIDYYYNLYISYKDLDGKEIKDHIANIDKNDENYSIYSHRIGYRPGYEMVANSDLLYEASSNIDEPRYNSYRYYLKANQENYSLKPGMELKFDLLESTLDGHKKINNDGKLLTIWFKEDISSTKLVTDSSFSYKFNEEDFPEIKMTSVYFVNGKFYRMPTEYYLFDENENKVNVEITTDKEEYKPGDTVKVKVKTTNNGKAIKTPVNISVVNEAVFAIQDDYTNILEQVYEFKDYPVYTYSTFIDELNQVLGGAGGGGDYEPRGKFEDTAYFDLGMTNDFGEANFEFKLPDNVTTFRITAHSANKDAKVGVGTKKITSKLDFFVQTVEPRNIKTSDDVVLNATAILNENKEVEYEFKIEELNKVLTAKGKTNNISTVNFGKLKYGTYTAVITGKCENYTDAIKFRFNVIESSQEVKTKTTTELTNAVNIVPTKNPIVLEIYNKKMSKYIEYMDFIESTETDRLDTIIAYNKVQELKNKYYNTDGYNGRNIDVSDYKTDNGYLKNLENDKEDIVLTALTQFYSNSYYTGKYIDQELGKDDNVFEYYLLSAAKGEAVLNDLLVLKQEKNITNYNKLLVTLSFEFLGDYTNARELYNTISLSEEEQKEYGSIIAIIDTFIAKDRAQERIDNIIKNKPEDEYIRFAILSYFENNVVELEKEDTVKVISNNLNEQIKVNGLEVKKLVINNEDLASIKFETSSNNLMVSYYYQTALENIESDNIKKDIKISMDKNIKLGDTVTLKVKFEKAYSGIVKIALPNGLRLEQGTRYNIGNNCWIENNNIDYITVYKRESCDEMKIPLIAILNGEYEIESVVLREKGDYHISNSLEVNIK